MARPRQQKPPYGARIDRSLPLAQTLGGFYALNEGAGPTLWDATGNLPIETAGFQSADPWASASVGTMPIGTYGASLACTAAGNGAYAALPAALQLNFPLTIACAVRLLSPSQTTAPPLVSLTVNSAGTAPYYAINISQYQALGVAYEFSSGTRALTWYSASSYAAPTDVVLGFTVTPSSASAYFAGAALGWSGGTGGNPWSVSWGTGPQFAIGVPPQFSSRKANALIYWAAWAPVEWTPAQHAAVGASPLAIFDLLYSRPGPRVIFDAGAAPPPPVGVASNCACSMP